MPVTRDACADEIAELHAVLVERGVIQQDGFTRRRAERAHARAEAARNTQHALKARALARLGVKPSSLDEGDEAASA